MPDDEHERSVARARARFLESGDVDRPEPEVRRVVLESWRRSRLFGVDVDRLDPPGQPDLDLDGKLVRAARPVLERLAATLAGTRTSAVLTDDRGRVLARRAGEQGLNAHLDEIRLAVGFSYAEEHVGTNGIGTALQARRPYQVFGSEHFSERLRNMSCAGSPIRDQLSGRLAGLLDLTCWSTDASPLMAALVAEAAADIEQRLLEHGSARERAMLTEFLAACRRSGAAVLTIGENLAMSNTRARNLLDANDHAIVRDTSERLLSDGVERSAQVLLSRGELAVLRCRPVRCAAGPAGAVVEIGLVPAPRRASAGETRPAGPRIAGGGAGFQNAGRELDRQHTAGIWTLVAGEPGVGKFALIEALHRRCRPAARLSVFDGRGWSDGDAERIAVALGRSGATVVLRGLDRLPGAAVEPVAGALDTFAGHWLAATAVESEAVAPALLRRFPVTVTVPPLRHRIGDLHQLVPGLLRKLAPGQDVCCGPAAMRILLRSQWPGNVSELVTVLRTALTRRRTGEIAPRDLPEHCHSTSRHVLTPWETLERDAIVRTLLETGGDKPGAAAMLGISRATIYRKIAAYGIVVGPEFSV